MQDCQPDLSRAYLDYHREMNGTDFKKWLKERLLTNLQRSSANVTDNASYRSVQKNKFPTSSTKEQEIKVGISQLSKTCGIIPITFRSFICSQIHYL